DEASLVATELLEGLGSGHRSYRSTPRGIFLADVEDDVDRFDDQVMRIGMRGGVPVMAQHDGPPIPIDWGPQPPGHPAEILERWRVRSSAAAPAPSIGIV